MSVLVIAAIAVIGLVVVFGLSALTALFLRKVVPTNEVHIVQAAKSTISYGKDHDAGNSYYKWPAWLPKVGVNVVVFPVSVFSLNLNEYDAYDKGRVPFVIDISAFFRINDSTMAAQRVSNFAELNSQLKSILQGAIRTILATSEIEEIMQGRGKFGDAFTLEVNGQLVEWGVATVKNVELMDIRDANGSKVIANIMEKKKSLIEMESRVEVAGNMKTAKVAEIEANQQTELRAQEMVQKVGIRQAQVQQEVGIAAELSQQAIKEQAKLTAEKDMAVQRVNEVKKAEIVKDVVVVQAEQQKDSTRIIAEGNLEATKRAAEGVTLTGLAKAEAEKAMQLAPISAQITLAQEIGENQGYQSYLIQIRQVEANQVVGVEQAKALTAANIKVIANAGDVQSGVSNVMDLFTTKGGTAMAGMLEGLAQSDVGNAVLKKIVNPAPKPVATK
jgi:flotillin